MRFTSHEIRDLAKAWVVISLAFTIANVGFRDDATFIAALVASLVTVGIGFILHELAHKLLAQRYGAVAVFHSFDRMLLFALLTSIFGIIFAIPGAVFIKTPLSPERHGRVALAGPMTNVLLALAFWAVSAIMQGPTAGVWALGTIAIYGAKINAFLAIFNMLPFFGADGQKVLAWSKTAYALGVVAAGAVMLLTSI